MGYKEYRLENCGGCITCEMACSLKQTGQFNHQLSSIHIVRDEEQMENRVRLFFDSDLGRIPCNGCVDIDGDPMCVQYCHERMDLREIIHAFIQETTREDGNGDGQ